MTMFQPVQPHMFVQGPPGRPSFIPQVQCRPELQGYIVRVTAVLQDEIQKRANNSIQRLALFYTMWYNNFQNQQFVKMVQYTLDYAEYLVFGCNLDFENALNQAMMEMIQIEIAKVIAADPNLQQQVTPDVITVCQSWLAKRQEIANWIGNYQRMGGAAGRMQAPQQQMAGFPQAGSYPQQMPPQHGNRQIQMLHSAGNTSQSTDPWVSLPAQPATPIVEAPKAIPEPAPTLMNPMADHVVHVNGAAFVRQITELSPVWPKPVKPYLMFPLVVIGHDVNAYWRFHDGKVTNYTASAQDDIMKKLDYALHENDKYLKARTAEIRNKEPDQAAARTALASVVQQSTIDELLAKLESQSTVQIEENVLVMEPARIERPLLRSDTADYHAMVTGLIDDKLELDVESCTVSFTAVTLMGWSFGSSCAETALAMGSARTIQKLREILYSLRSSVAYYYWDSLDAIVTKHLNALLRAGLGLDLSIDSFCEDLDDLIGYMQQHAPDRLQLLMTRGFQQLRDTTCHLDNADIMRDAGVTVGETDSTPPTYVLIEDVTLLPVTSADMGLVCPGEQGVVTSTTNPAMYGALEARMKRRHARTRYMKFITLDNQAFWVYESLSIDSAYVVSTTEL